MDIKELEANLNILKLENKEFIKTAIIDDYNDYEAGIFIQLFSDVNKRAASTIIKKFFREMFDTKIYINFNNDYNGYLFDVEYKIMCKNIKKIENSKKIMVFSRKLENKGLYNGDKTFSKNVLQTADIAISKEHHIELLENIYPNHTILPLYTFEHRGSFSLDLEPNYSYYGFDSSADSFIAYKTDFSEVLNTLKNINDSIFLC